MQSLDKLYKMHKIKIVRNKKIDNIAKKWKTKKS